MATATLLGEELARGDLPRVCIRCGSRRGVTFVQRAFVWRPYFSPWMLLRIIPVRRLTTYVPLCEAHGGFNWFPHRRGQWWGLRPTGIDHDRMTLAGASDEFADALRRHRQGRREARYEEDVPDALPADVLPVRRSREWRDPYPANGSSWVVPLIVLAVPLVACGGFCMVGEVASLFMPRRLLPPPVVAPAGPGLPTSPPAGEEVRREFVGTLAFGPAGGLPGAVPWAALALSCRNEPPRLLSEAEWNKALQDLHSGAPFAAPEAARRLAESIPDQERRPAAADALRPLLSSRWPQVRESAARALGVWGTADDAPALIALLNDPFPTVQGGALDGLAALKDERGAVAAAQRLTSFVGRDGAARALTAMGPIAEKAVTPFLANPDASVRAVACHVLKAVGTKESLPALENAARDPNPTTAEAAAAAVRAVKARS